MLNYSKIYTISMLYQDFRSLAVTSQAPSPALSVGKSEGESSFIIGSIYARYLHINRKWLLIVCNHNT